jgi:hypothetical protein
VLSRDSILGGRGERLAWPWRVGGLSFPACGALRVFDAWGVSLGGEEFVKGLGALAGGGDVVKDERGFGLRSKRFGEAHHWHRPQVSL